MAEASCVGKACCRGMWLPGGRFARVVMCAVLGALLQRGGATYMTLRVGRSELPLVLSRARDACECIEAARTSCCTRGDRASTPEGAYRCLRLCVLGIETSFGIAHTFANGVLHVPARRVLYGAEAPRRKEVHQGPEDMPIKCSSSSS